MNFLILILGICLIVSGVFLINYFRKLKKENKTGGLSFKLQTAGIGLVIIGIALIIRVIF